MKNMFNIQKLFHHKSKHYENNSMHILLIKGFPRVPKVQWEMTCLGDINVTNKTTKLPSYILV